MEGRYMDLMEQTKIVIYGFLQEKFQRDRQTVLSEADKLFLEDYEIFKQRTFLSFRL